MSIAKKRSRTGEPREQDERKDAQKEVLPSGTVALSPKTPRWRSRKRTQIISGTADGTDEKTQRDGSLNSRDWAIVNSYGGKFKPKSIFSKDEK